MKINITVGYKNDDGGQQWTEDYDIPNVKNISDANIYADRLIQGFNDTLRPREKARKVVAVEIVGESGPQNHDWTKTNLVTIMNGRDFYDTLLCERCFITAKRFGLDRIVVDRQFRAKKFQKCVK